jgi:hypothetical protein
MMEKIQIDVGIAIPEITGVGRKSLYPIDQMKVGDSFFTTKKSVQRAVTLFKKKHLGTDFTTRRVDGGWRTWRTK